jgi:hypothetical protein
VKKEKLVQTDFAQQRRTRKEEAAAACRSVSKYLRANSNQIQTEGLPSSSPRVFYSLSLSLSISLRMYTSFEKKSVDTKRSSCGIVNIQQRNTFFPFYYYPGARGAS